MLSEATCPPVWQFTYPKYAFWGKMSPSLAIYSPQARFLWQNVLPGNLLTPSMLSAEICPAWQFTHPKYAFCGKMSPSLAIYSPQARFSVAKCPVWQFTHPKYAFCGKMSPSLAIYSPQVRFLWQYVLPGNLLTPSTLSAAICPAWQFTHPKYAFCGKMFQLPGNLLTPSSYAFCGNMSCLAIYSPQVHFLWQNVPLPGNLLTPSTVSVAKCPPAWQFTHPKYAFCGKMSPCLAIYSPQVCFLWQNVLPGNVESLGGTPTSIKMRIKLIERLYHITDGSNSGIVWLKTANKENKWYKYINHQNTSIIPK